MKNYKIVNNTSYHAEIPDEVIAVLEKLRLSKERCRIYYGDVLTGKAWLNEHDIFGTISRSTGDSKIPLLIASSRATGGGALLDHCIIRIDTKHRVLYKHPSFNTGKWQLINNDVFHNGILYASFDSELKAKRYIKFITGDQFGR